MSVEPAARVGDPFCHTLAMDGALAGLMVGAVIVVGVAATVATGGLAGAAAVIAVGAAVSAAGGLGMAGAYIGDSVPGASVGVLEKGSPDVRIDGLHAATSVVIGSGKCRNHGADRRVATGAASVHINGLPAARVREKLECSAQIQHGSPTVRIGGPSVAALPLSPEIPRPLSVTMQAMMWGGLAVATGGTAYVAGAAVAAGGLALGLVGSKVVGSGARAVAAKLGAGETGQRVAEVVGGLLGGFAGGAAGAKGGSYVEGPLGTPVAEMPLFGGKPPASATDAFLPKQSGRTEPGAVPATPELKAQIAAASTRSAMSSPGYPDLPEANARTFGDGVRPWDGDTHSGPIRRVVDQESNPNGSYWQSDVPSDEASWRGGSAVLNNWNGDGAYVESSPSGLKGWIGPAAPQIGSDGVTVLPGSGEQIWMPPNQASPSAPMRTPWNTK